MKAINLTTSRKYTNEKLLSLSNEILGITEGPIVESIERMPTTFNNYACDALVKCNSYLKRNVHVNIANVADTIHLNLPLFVNYAQPRHYLCAVIFDCDQNTFNLLYPYMNVMNILPVRV
jgi:hypothetical protein